MMRRSAWLGGWLLLLSALPSSAVARDRPRSEPGTARARTAARSERRPSPHIVILAEPPPTQLTPPPLLTTTSAPPDRDDDLTTRRERRLRDIEPRKRLFWIDASTGAAYLRARRLNIEHGIVQSNTLATAFRVGAGLRVEFFTLGVFLTHARFSDAPLSTGGMELGLRVPLGRIEPFLRALVGYAWEGATKPNQAEISGFALGGSLGLACFLQRHLSMELSFDGSIIAVAAHSIDLSDADQEAVDEARRKLERTSLARLSALRLGLTGHF